MKWSWSDGAEFDNVAEAFRCLLEFSSKSRYDLQFYNRWGISRPSSSIDHQKTDETLNKSFYKYLQLLNDPDKGGEAAGLVDVDDMLSPALSALRPDAGGPTMMTSARERVDAVMKALHESLRDNGSTMAMDRAAGWIDALEAVGLLTRMEAVGWRATIEICPGHEACRVWCAYCGDLPREDENDAEPVDR